MLILSFCWISVVFGFTNFLFSMIGIGFSSLKASVERLPGWETESWAYHGDDGKSFFGESQGQGRAYGPTFGVGDTVGCGVNFSTGSAFFTKNGVFLGTFLVISKRDIPG